MKSVLVWSWRGGEPLLNFGEYFCELILWALGYEIKSFDQELAAGRIRQYSSCLMIIGSEFHRSMLDNLLVAVPEVHVWGQGNGRGKAAAVDMQQSPYRDRVKVFALRGPLTKSVSNVTDDVPLCDPGFLLPKLYPLGVSRGDQVLYIPHWSNHRDTDARLKRLDADKCLTVITSRHRVMERMNEIARARFVLTNTLHTFIFCLAYRVPCAIAVLDEEQLEMPDKWNDVLLSMGSTDGLCPVKNLAEGQAWWNSIGQHLPLPDADRLLASFPYPPREPFSTSDAYSITVTNTGVWFG